MCWALRLDKPVHRLPLCAGFLGVEYMTVFQLDDVTGLHSLTPLEDHEIRPGTGEVEPLAPPDLTLVGKQHPLGHDLLLEECVQIGDVGDRGGDYRLKLRSRRYDGGLDLTGQFAQ